MHSAYLQFQRNGLHLCCLMLFLLHAAQSYLLSEEVPTKISKPYLLPDQSVLTVVSFDDSDGVYALAVVKLTAQEETAEREIYRLNLGRTSGTVFENRRSPVIMSAVKQENKLALLFGAESCTEDDGYYVLIQSGTDNNYEQQTALRIADLLPANGSFRSQSPKSLDLLDLSTIQLVHHDDFVSVIKIAEDNSVTINGKPCAPNNAPVDKIYYKRFLRVLSPETEATYDYTKTGYQPVTWWDETKAPSLPHVTEPKPAPPTRWDADVCAEPCAGPPRLSRPIDRARKVSGESNV